VQSTAQTNPYSEAWVRAIKAECLNNMILFGERHVRYVVEQYARHHNEERPHKGLDYRRPIEPDTPPTREGQVKCHERLGGLLKSYYRKAA
jgi:putative transposase